MTHAQRQPVEACRYPHGEQPYDSGDIQGLALIAARKEYRKRRSREKLFGQALFSDPVWDMLLDLFIAACEGRRECITSACAAAAAPTSTALRHIAEMERRGLVRRSLHPSDNRARYLEISDSAFAQMLKYFAT